MLKRLLMIGAMGVSSAALAGDFYVVGAVGSARVDANQSDSDGYLISDGVTNLTSRVSKNNTKYKLQLGYQFNEYFAVEGGYIDFGKAKYSAEYNESSGSRGTAREQFKVNGWNVSAVGTLPVNSQFSLFGKVGAIAAKVKLEEKYTVAAPTPDSYGGTYSSTDWKGAWGVGATYHFSPQLGVRFEYEKFDKLGDRNKTGEYDTSFTSIGLVYTFK